MSDFWSSVAASVIASVAYTFLITIMFLLITSTVIKHHRRALFSMLCIHPDGATIRVFLSRLDVLPGGSKGTDGVLALGFTGPALMQLEYEGALLIQRLVRERFVDVMPRLIRALIRRSNPYLTEVDFLIDVAPDERSFLSLLDNGADSNIFLGSDVYSHAVRRVYRDESTFIRFVAESTGENFDAGKDASEEPTFAVRTADLWYPVPARSIGREVGTIQRVTLKTGRRVLMCAGISASATYGSARFFYENWRALHQRFGGDDFLVVLAFRDQEPDTHAVHPPEELLDLSRRRPTPS
jgi:hypothetical protein